MKKYRLKIPEMIEKRHAWIAHALQLEDMTILENFTFETQHGTGCFCDIPESWLEEINDHPVTAYEWLRSEFPERYDRGVYIDTGGYHDANMLDAFRAGEKNERKRHRAKTSVKEAWIHDNTVRKKNLDFERYKRVWKDCLKSHNLEGIDDE